MNNTERFNKVLNFDKNADRLPMIEWAGWWDLTLNEWWAQGLPRELEIDKGINEYFGQDRHKQFWPSVREAGFPNAPHHGAPVLYDEKDYDNLRKMLFTDKLLDDLYSWIKTFQDANADKGYVYWFTLEGGFWFPRTLFGIQNHLYAFYDYPDLMHRMIDDLGTFSLKLMDVIFSLIQPAFMTLAEDMSYNHGPMLSRELYDEFVLPYYKRVVPVVRQHGTKAFIDTDGNVEPLIPWFLDGGIQGVLPLERMAGVDVNRIRENYPDFLMIGGFDKTIMHKGEAALRAEFERVMPAMKAGGYIPAVDHQTPPAVSLEDYKTYMKLMLEYSTKANEK